MKKKWKEEIILLGEKYYNRNLNIVINVILYFILFILPF